jgi:small subunit ribosomal protein S12
MSFHRYKFKPRIPKDNYCVAVSLKKNPQMRARYIRTVHRTPKKPNSALRKTGKVVLRTGKIVYAKTIGSGNLPMKFAIILIRGKGFRDTPASNYAILRGTWECPPVYGKARRRSIFGQPQDNLFKFYKKERK